MLKKDELSRRTPGISRGTDPRPRSARRCPSCNPCGRCRRPGGAPETGNPRGRAWTRSLERPANGKDRRSLSKSMLTGKGRTRVSSPPLNHRTSRSRDRRGPRGTGPRNPGNSGSDGGCGIPGCHCRGGPGGSRRRSGRHGRPRNWARGCARTGHDDVRTPLLDQRREEGEMIVLDEDEGRVVPDLLEDRVGEPLVDRDVDPASRFRGRPGERGRCGRAARGPRWNRNNRKRSASSPG